MFNKQDKDSIDNYNNKNKNSNNTIMIEMNLIDKSKFLIKFFYKK